MLAIDTAAGFADALLAVERAWALLDRGDAAEALAAAPDAAQVVVRAAAMLPAAEARRVLEDGLALDGAPAPLQLALARALAAAGEWDAARRRFRSALLRARPDGALLAELAGLEVEAGDGPAAAVMLALAEAVPLRDHDAARRGADRLAALGRDDLALLAYALAHRRGSRDPRLYAGYGAVLERRPGFADVRAAASEAGPALAPALTRMAAFGTLSTAPDRAALLAEAVAREQRPEWVTRADLPAMLRAAVAAARPFSWVRLGDGEGRFLLRFDPALRHIVPDDAAEAEADGIWRNWFGEGLANAPRSRVTAVAAGLRDAAAAADLLGLTPVDRLRHDHYHFPYCALAERFAASLPPTPRRLTSANHAVDLASDDPHLGSILGGLDFIGFVGPHGDLAPRLAARLGIAAHRTWVVPGETRLGRTEAERHLPDVFDRVMATLALPRPGAVVLVAAGLLGKLYAARVRALGGVALDIGAVADAWMGINSRGGALDPVVAHALPPI